MKERNIHERTDEYPQGTPIVGFVRIEPGSFMMGGGDAKVLTTISTPFEFMSVDVPQSKYRGGVELMKRHLRSPEYGTLNPDPSKFKGENRPVETVSYDDVSLWVNGLNELSKSDDPQIQEALTALFPGHKRGKTYSRPTEAQWELVSRLGGVAESDYSHGKGEAGLGDYAVYNKNSGSQTKPVGSKKPVFYNGEPIYDLHGNVLKWTDPVGPASGSDCALRGGSWGNLASILRSGHYVFWSPYIRHDDVGFRLMRTAE